MVIYDKRKTIKNSGSISRDASVVFFKIAIKAASVFNLLIGFSVNGLSTIKLYNFSQNSESSHCDILSR